MDKHLLSFALSVGVVAASAGLAKAEAVWVSEPWTCAQWAARDKGTSPIERYLVGIIDGMSLGAMLNLWQLPTKIEKDQLFYWMDQYCASNPLKDIVMGAVDFASERRGNLWRDR